MDDVSDIAQEDLPSRLRRVASTLPSPDDAKRQSIEEGLLLGLPDRWLSELPLIGDLPGDYVQADFGEDAFLRWKAQEHLARSGRVDRCDPALLADALETAAAEDGPCWIHESLKNLLFALAWPGPRTFALHTRIAQSAEHLIDGLEASPSALPFADPARSWHHVTHDITMLAPDAELPEECLWEDLRALLVASAARIEEGNDMESRRIRGEDLPDEYRHFLD